MQHFKLSLVLKFIFYFRCGVRLLKHFEKKSKELGLKLPEEMQEDSDSDSPKIKKRRTKQ